MNRQGFFDFRLNFAKSNVVQPTSVVLTRSGRCGFIGSYQPPSREATDLLFEAGFGWVQLGLTKPIIGTVTTFSKGNPAFISKRGLLFIEAVGTSDVVDGHQENGVSSGGFANFTHGEGNVFSAQILKVRGRRNTSSGEDTKITFLKVTLVDEQFSEISGIGEFGSVRSRNIRGPADEGIAGGGPVEGHLLGGKVDLAGVIQCLNELPACDGACDCRDRQCRENRDNGNDHQQFNKRKTSSGVFDFHMYACCAVKVADTGKFVKGKFERPHGLVIRRNFSNNSPLSARTSYKVAKSSPNLPRGNPLRFIQIK